MIPTLVHAMVAAEDEERVGEVILRVDSGVDLANDLIHFLLLGDHVGAARC